MVVLPFSSWVDDRERLRKTVGQPEDDMVQASLEVGDEHGFHCFTYGKIRTIFCSPID